MKVSSNGISLNVRDTGVGETAIVFLHFWGGSSRTWDGVIELLAARYRCVAIDARGAGDSDAPTEHYRTEDHATDALNVTRALRLNRFVLVGHSMGGKAAQLLASWHPRGLMALVLVATSPLAAMAINDEQREQMRRAYENRKAVEWTLDKVLSGSPIPPEPRARLIEDALRLSPEGRAGWLDIGSREDLTNRAAPVHIPVVIVAGLSDRVDPVAVVKTHVIPRYPQALVRLLPNKGHLLPLEAPRDIAALIDGVAHPFQQTEPEEMTMSSKAARVVFVHGAWADGSSWSKVIPLLQRQGICAVAVQLPLAAFAADVATVRRAIALQDGPVVLVGHSYGGAVITEAGNDPKVVGLVYVAAFAPDDGESVASTGSTYPPAPMGAQLRPDTEGFLSITRQGFHEDFAQDLTQTQIDTLWATQGPTHGSVFGAVISKAAWKVRPSWFVVAEHDRAIPPALEQDEAKRMKATTVTLPASHLVMLSHPEEVAELVEKAARGAV